MNHVFIWTLKDIVEVSILGLIGLFILFLVIQDKIQKIKRNRAERRKQKLLNQPAAFVKQKEVPLTPNVFGIGDKLIHVKTGGRYKIVGLPANYVIEATREPAYAYLMPDGRVCIRCQKEMEDGRFIKANWESQNTEMRFDERRKETQPVSIDRRRM